MAQAPIEDLLKRCSSIYRLVILAAKRAKEIADGAPPLVHTPQRKVTSIALEEILQGKVLYKPDEAEERGKRRSKSDKKRKS
jgi:DNA-directed RNA polymerase subunit omega